MAAGAPQAASIDGRIVGDFRLIERLGAGGMGAAYLAEQLTLRREAVVKVVLDDVTSEEAKVRFLREARLASQLDHPYAAHVYAFGAEPDGLLWIAMELVRGVPLDQLIADQGPMPLARFVPFFDRLCEVVFSAHEQGIIHRDIKPANVMVVRRAGRLLPKLLDFGVARSGVFEPEQPRASRDSSVEASLVDSPLDEGSRSVTVRGRLGGSPAYMAPEQWLDAADASPLTDLYALAITAYETLTGHRPFTGNTLLEIARAHARNKVPPVGGSLPVEIDQVFSRALSKRQADRQTSVLELAASFRAISLGIARETSTDFDEVVRETFVERGPQPLAESLLALSAARAPQAARDAAWRVVDVLARVLATTALAARARFGARDTESAARHIVALMTRGLDLDEWFALSAALTAPFATRVHAFAVPELVALVWDDGQPRRVFDRLLALRSDHRAEQVEAAAVSHLLVELGVVLRASAFLADYPWVAAGGDTWMGPRRNPREHRELPATSGVWLTDLDGTALVELSPLVRIAPPSPGADDELFLIDGPAKRGARSVSWPREFERFDEDSLRFVDEHLARVDARSATDDRDLAPFRGLASFGAGDASMFFGREREVEAVVNRLRIQPMIAVVGPSGVGKSSFVHAGVVPALPDTWHTLSLRPGIDPLGSIERRLIAANAATAGLAEQIRNDPAALSKTLDVYARSQGGAVVVVVDQLEELFTQCRDQTTREQLARALARVGRSDSAVRLVATLRDDFLVRAAELPDLGPLLATSLELVTLPDPVTLRRILVEPLRQVGYSFEIDTMPDEMVAAVREHPGALALLSFAAAKLWELRDRSFRQLTLRSYEAIGGVAGALARHAEDTLSQAAADDHPLVRELFRHLVTSEGTRAALRRSEAIELLGKGPRAERVIELLVESRLLVGYEGAGGADWIEVVHEALLSAWPRLVTWQREDAEGARLRGQLRSAARQWGERGRPKGLLWRKEVLVEYRMWRVRHAAALTDLELEFASASIADEARSRRLRRLALATVLVGLVIGLVVLQRANKVAERNADESRRLALASLVEQGRSAAISGRPQDAMVYLSAAYSRGADDRNLKFLLGQAKRALGGELLALRGHTGGIKSVVFTPDGARIVTAGTDETVRVWDAKTGAVLQTVKASGDLPYSVIELVGDDGVLTWGPAERPAVWALATGTKRFELATKGSVARVTPDGRTIVTLDPAAGELTTWDVSGARTSSVAVADAQPLFRVGDGRYAIPTARGVVVGPLDLSTQPVTLPCHPSGIALSANGRWLAEYEDDNATVRLWDLDEPKPAARLVTGQTGDVIRVYFSPDSTQLAIPSMDHTVKLWSTETGRLIASLAESRGFVYSLAWTRDSTRIATGAVDGTVRVWDAHTGAPLGVFYGHTDEVFALAFDNAGERLLSGAFDNVARMFDARPQVEAISIGHRTPAALRVSGDSKRLLVFGYDLTASVYDVSTGKTLAAIDRYRRALPSSRIDANADMRSGDIDSTGKRIVLPIERQAIVIPVDDVDHPRLLGPEPGEILFARFVADGRTVTAGVDGHLSVWSADGRLLRSVPANKLRILAFAIYQAYAVASFEDGTTRWFSLDADVPPRVFPGSGAPDITDLVISPTGDRFATANLDGFARVYDASTGALLASPRGPADLWGIAFSPDAERIAVSDRNGTVTLFDSRDARSLAVVGDTTAAWTIGLVYLPDDSAVAAVDDSGLIRIWKMIGERRGPSEVARDAECHIAEQLVGTQLVGRTPPTCQ